MFDRFLKYILNPVDDQLYAFGEKFGDGSDSSHFQLGLTS
jgi:hypothetical protein